MLTPLQFECATRCLLFNPLNLDCGLGGGERESGGAKNAHSALPSRLIRENVYHRMFSTLAIVATIEKEVLAFIEGCPYLRVFS